MKKFLTLFVAIAMMLTFTVNTFATDSIDVNVTVDEDAAPDTVYNVTLEWVNADFTYHIGADRDWNDDSSKVHGYTSSTETGWGEDREESVTGTVKVWNHSNAAINVSAEANTTAATVTGVSVALNTGAATPTNLAMPTIGSAWSEAPATTYTCTVSGTPNASGKVASIVITIS